MKPLSQHITEALTKSKILAHKHTGLQPSDIKHFLEIAKSEGFKVGKDEDDYTIVYNSKEVIARIDDDELEVYTNIDKQTFFDVALRKKKGVLKHLFESFDDINESTLKDGTQIIVTQKGENFHKHGTIEMMSPTGGYLVRLDDKSIVELEADEIKKK